MMMSSSRSSITLGVVLTAVILGMSVSGSTALKCYSCSSCEDDNLEDVTCEDGQDTCMKVTINSVTYRGCNQQEACAAGKFIQDGIGSAWESIKGIFNSDIQKSETGKPMECCTTDYCNNTNIMRTSPLLMLMMMMTITAVHWIKTY